MKTGFDEIVRMITGRNKTALALSPLNSIIPCEIARVESPMAIGTEKQAWEMLAELRGFCIGRGVAVCGSGLFNDASESWSLVVQVSKPK